MPSINSHRDPYAHHHHATVASHHHHSPPKRNPKLLSFFLKFIIMSLILSIFLIFLGLAAILLLHLFLAGSFLHRRRQNAIPPLTANYSFQDLQNHLPPFQYSSAASADCSICLDYFKEGDFCRALPMCDHIFHAHCVDSWLTKVPNCPVCRTRVRLETGRPSDAIVSDDDYKFLWWCR